MRFAILAVSLLIVTSIMTAKYVFFSSAGGNTIMGISHDLACPCECPMVLEDCHMSCGLSWKDKIGQKILDGLNRDEINAFFYKRFGDEAMLTPLQRMSGKWYQLTRGGYPLGDMVLFVLIVAVWVVLLYTVLVMIVEGVRGEKI